MSGIQQLLLAGGGAAVPVDPYFYSVTSLLHGDGTNGGQNNTFLDSSTNNFTITRNGNTTQGSFSPFSQTGWSGYFDGSGDYCTLSSNVSMDFGAGNFTIECFVNTGVFSISAGASRTIIGNSGNSYTMQLYIDTTSGKVVFGNTGSTNLQGTGTVADNQWHHIVVVRSGTGSNQTALFVDGQRQAVGTNSQNYSSGTIYLGAFDTGNGFWNGYISNLRIVKGTAVYDPTATTLTVPTTPLTAVSNTALLTLQSNRFLDNSTNAYTVTKAGDTSIQPFSPFNPITAYSTSAVGGSGYFDGSGDYLQAGTNANLALGSGDFTIEGWHYCTGYNGGGGLYSTINTYPSSTGLLFYIDSIGRYTIDVNGTILQPAGTAVLNAWVHWAVVRNGSTLSIYINGTSIGSVSSSTNYTDQYAVIGRTGAGTNSNLFLGYLSSTRMVKGTAVYTANFTPPTAPLTAVTNTQLLCNFTNGAIFDNAAVADYETAGNAQISTSVKKYGTGSLAFDGTGDYLLTDPPSAQLMAFGTGDFTVEMWVYFNAIGTDVYHFYDSRPASTDGAYPTLRTNASAQIEYVANSAVRITGLTLTTNTWYHVALCRTASQTKLFVNGTQTGSTYADTTNYLNAAARPLIGGSGFHVTTLGLNGYVDDVRITKGVARYPYNFTPPTAEFPNIGGTVTLTADPYFDYTTLLLPGNGTNGAQNNTFLDGSTNNFTITRNGNTTQGTFSPFSQTGWSNYFDGTGDSLTTPSITIGSGDFTIEGWQYMLPNGANYGRLVGVGDFFNSSGFSINFNPSTLKFEIGNANSNFIISSSTFSYNTWYHIAVVRSGSTVTLYVNGTSQGSATNTNSISGVVYISAVNYLSTIYYALSYTSNVRITTSAVYTTNFTPPTAPLTAISNTQLLTCQSNRFIDNSTNNFAITRNGDVSVQAFSPFNPTAAWSAATYGGSGYFDGSGDYLTTNATQAIPATGDFTIEAWVYPTVSGPGRNIVSQGTAGASGRTQLSVHTNNTLQLGITTTIVYSTGTVTPNAWNYVAVTRTGSSVTFYINGANAGTATASGTIQNTTLEIGGEWNGDPYRWLGYIASIRISNTLRTISSSPTAPLTSDGNTVFLCNFTNAGIYDATSKNDLETVGNAQISTTQSKFGGSSMYFDGTGDYLTIPDSPALRLGTGDFTIEGWFYTTTTSGARCIFYKSQSNTNGVVLLINNGSAGSIDLLAGNGSWSVILSGSNAISTNTWTHLAAVRYGDVWKVFSNGIELATTTNSVAAANTTEPATIGYFRSANPFEWSGYMQDVRITKGIARYTSNFTPPTTAFLTL